MPSPYRYQGLDLAPDFSSGTNAVGGGLTFTRHERLVLRALVQAQGRTLTRDYLLNCVSGIGSDSGDRNVDFVINRLRRKLGDPVRTPRFIATRYGEGYTWIALPVKTEAPATDMFVIVGPVSRPATAQATPAAETFADHLTRSLDRLTGDRPNVMFDAGYTGSADGGTDQHPYNVALTFYNDDERRMHCAVSVHTRHGTLITASRVAISAPATDISRTTDITDDLAEAILHAIWSSMSVNGTAGPFDAPIAVRLHDASKHFGSVLVTQSWQESQTRLRARLAEHPEDPATRLMLATAIHTKYITGIDLSLATSDPRRADEAEMEELVIGALPLIGGDGVLELTAAKLLYFLTPAYREMAVKMAETAFESTTAFATAFAIMGQLRMWQGRIEESLTLFDQGLRLTGQNRNFDLYLVAIHCNTYAAAGDDKAVGEAIAPIADHPIGREVYRLLHKLPPQYESDEDTERALSALTLDQAKSKAMRFHYTNGRLFARQDHRQNSMRRLMTLLTAKFGPQVVPAEIAPDLPPELAIALPKHG